MMSLAKPRESVLWFAGWMEQKLLDNESRGGWENCDDSYLVRRIADERCELARLIRKLERRLRNEENLSDEDYRRVFCEAADVANFAMMIADNWHAAHRDRSRRGKRK